MNSYLVTGGCGFIGSHLCEQLIAQGHHVRILDDLSTGKIDNVPESCELVIGNIIDHKMVTECLKGIDFCYHLAAISSVTCSNRDWNGTHRINQSGSLNVFQAAAINQTPVVYASSAAVYGDNADTRLRESAVARPLTAYGADKLGSEAHARVASVVHQVPTTGLRLFNVYGPRQSDNTSYSSVISSFAMALQNDQPLIIYGNGKQIRDFIYVDDVVQFFLSAMKHISYTPKLYNVCTGRSLSIHQLANTMMSITGKCVPINYQPSRAGDIQISVGDPSLSLQQLEYRAQTSLATGLYQLLPKPGSNFGASLHSYPAILEAS